MMDFQPRVQVQVLVQVNVQLQETLYTIQKYANMQKLANVCKTIPKYAKVWRNVQQDKKYVVCDV